MGEEERMRENEREIESVGRRVNLYVYDSYKQALRR